MNRKFIDVLFIILFLTNVIVVSELKKLDEHKLAKTKGLSTLEVINNDNPYQTSVMGIENNNADKKTFHSKNEAQKAFHFNDNSNQINEFFVDNFKNKCFYDSVDNMIGFLRKSINYYNQKCSFQKHTDLKNLIEIAVNIGKIEVYNDKIEPPKHIVKLIEDLRRFKDFSFSVFLEKLFEAVNAKKSRNHFLNEIKIGISEKIDSIIKEKNLAHFVRSNIWKLIETQKVLTNLIENFGEKEKGCIPSNWSDILHIYDLISDFNFKSIITSKHHCILSGNELILRNDDFEQGGIAFSFFGDENLIELNENNNKIFRGYVQGTIRYEYSLIPKKNSVIHRISIGNEIFEFDSESSCAGYYFVLVSIQKDCDSYKIIISTRFLGGNKRTEISRKIASAYIENTHFYFNQSLWSRRIYRNFKYDVSKEVIVMSLSLNEQKLNKLKETSKCMKECLYSVKRRCVKCEEGLILSDGRCITECPKNTFLSNSICEPCHKNCSRCFGRENGKCSKCEDPFVLSSGKCLVKCPSNKFPNNSGKCEKCNRKCLICKDINNCGKCKVGSFLIEGKCVIDCPNGFYRSFNPNKCNSCSLNCASCDSLDSCFRCKNGFFLKHGNECVANCGDNYFADLIDNRCKLCKQNCVGCDNTENCLKCLKGFVLTPQKTCVKKCSNGFVDVNGSCSSCSDPNCDVCHTSNLSKCVKCSKNKFLKNGKCVDDCGLNYYSDDRKKCRKCQDKCEICNKEKCLQCSGNLVLFENRVCLEKCYPGEIRIGNHCVKCNNPLNCRSCSSENLNTCTECYSNKILFNGKCVKECPKKTYLFQGKCVPCIKGCEVCSNSHNCEICSQNWFLEDNICVDCCKSGSVEKNGKCQKCSVEDCDECLKSDVTICKKCKSGHFMYNNKCLKKCPKSTFTTKHNDCQNCKLNCVECVNDKECSKCEIGKFLQVERNECVSFCDDGFKNEDGKCVKCMNSKCKKCENDKKVCSECHINFYLHQGTCIEKCPPMTFPIKQECKKCRPPCKNCVNDNKCLSCVENFYLTDDKECLDNCPKGMMKKHNHCLKCVDPNCEKCIGNADKCVKCKNPFTLLEGNCYQECPIGYYDYHGECKTCLPGCEICSDSKKCLKCRNGLLLKNDSECVSKCGNGYIRSGIECNKCSVRCKKCLNSNAAICRKCENGLFLSNGDCVWDCPSSTWKNRKAQTCESCGVSHCSKCEFKNVCERCNPGFVLERNKCVVECSLGFTLNVNTNICEECKVENCDKCLWNNLNRCEKCKYGFWKISNEKCVNSCPRGTFKNLRKQECKKCSDNCLNCSDNTNCLECSINTYLLNGKCRKRCPSGFTIEQNRCVNCNERNCLICNNPKKCEKCKHPFLLENKSCVLKCSEGNFNNKSKCEPCGLNCQNCFNQNTCRKCKSGFSLFKGRCLDKCGDSHYSINGQCEKCKTGENCLKCSNSDPSNCVECKNGFFLKSHECVNNCGLRYFSKNKKCEKCEKRCLICHNDLGCLRCEKEMYLYNKGCVSQCPEGWFNSNGKCLRCSTGKCRRCPNNKCLECETEFLLENNKCVNFCDEGYFKVDNFNCEKCGKDCLDCRAKGECLKCNEGLFLSKGVCVKDCEKGEIAIRNQCLPCRDNCLKCAKNDQRTCLKCNEGYNLYSGKCVLKCPPTTFLNKITKKCETSHVNNCAESREKICLRCLNPYILSSDKKSCVKDCEEGYFRGEKQCEKCRIEYCGKCTSDRNKCDKCKFPYLLKDETCVKSCNIHGWYRNRDGTKCKKCNIECESCLSKNLCKRCKSGFLLKNGRCVNKCGTGFTKSDEECIVCKTQFCEICSDDGKKCLRCVKGKVLNENKCEDDCCFQTFSYRGKCENCIKNCDICSNSKECSVCSKGFLKEKGKCVKKCSKFYVEKNGECVRCSDDNCLECEKTNLNICKICDSEFSLKSNRCELECQENFYKFKISSKISECRPCSDHCKTCKNQESCDECHTGFKIKSKQCVMDCGENWVFNGRECKKCQPNCLQCDNRNQSTCLKCDSKSVLKNGQCVDKCGEGYISLNGVCNNCFDSNCQSCGNDRRCEKCKQNYFNFEGKCLSKCPSGFVPNENSVCIKCQTPHCKQCNPSNLKECLKCKQNFLLQENNTCDEDCCDGYYNFNNQKCLKCSANCLLCENANTCKKCKEDLYLDKSGLCIDKCPNGSTIVNGKCVDCRENQCLRCKQNNPEICEICKNGWFLRSGKCINRCPKRTYPISNICESCPINCARCKSNICEKCINPFVLNEDGTCQKACFDGYVNVDGKCKKCISPRVKKCKEDRKIPIECYKNFFLYNDDCVEICPPSTYLKSNKCETCSNNCEKCKNSEYCEKCSKGLLSKGECVDECPEGTVNIIGECKNCNDKACHKCRISDLKYCVECGKGKFNHEGKCVTSCPEGTFLNENSNECQNCDEKCEICKNREKCKKCRHGFVLSGKKCETKCKGNEVEISGTCFACRDKNCELCSQSNLNECLKCKQGFLFKGICIPKCPATYRGDLNLKTCVECSKFCETCDSKKCIKCLNGFFKAKSNPKFCVNCNKPGRYLLINKNGEKYCDKCKIKHCLKCSEENPKKCDICHLSTVKINGKCLVKCPKGTFRKDQNCITCSENCLKCSSKETCFECKKPSILFSGRCLIKCKPGFVAYHKKCMKCHQNNCLVCLPHNRSKCKICDKNSFKYGDSCYYKCPHETYPLNGECRKCRHNCALCDKEKCVKCENSLYLKDGECVEECGEGYSNSKGICVQCHDENCFKCKIAEKCDKCSSGYFFSPLGKCSSSCPTGYYKNKIEKSCEKCPKGCKRCNDRDSCEECEKGLLSHEGKCFKNCPRGYAKSDIKCLKCDQDECETCVDGNKSKCEKCDSNYLLYKHVCIEKCPVGTFKLNSTCKECDQKCEKCINEGKCLKCKYGFKLTNGLCLNECPQGMTQYNGRCIECKEKNCSSCSFDAEICFECKFPYYLDDTQCKIMCPKTKFNSLNRQCMDCQTGCEICKNETSCDKCEKGWFKHNGKCTKVCPERTFNNCDDRICQECNEACEECVSAKSSNCSKCTKGFYLNERSCVSAINCRFGTFPDILSRKCEKCNLPFCNQCASRNACRKCMNGYIVIDGKCVQTKSNVSVINDQRILFSENTRKLLKKTEIKSVQNDLKSIGVASDNISFSFWIKRITKSSFDTEIFKIYSKLNPKSIRFSIANIKGIDKCEITSGNNKWHFEGCEYKYLKKWSHFTITIEREENRAHLKVFNSNLKTGLVSFDLSLFNQHFIDNDSILEFNSNKLASSITFELSQFIIYDYKLEEDELESVLNKKPAYCMFSCNDCREKCYSCEGGVKPKSGKCDNTSYISVIRSLHKFYNRHNLSLRSKVQKKLDSSQFAFSTWIYLSDSDDKDLTMFLYEYSYSETIIGASLKDSKIVIKTNNDNVMTKLELKSKKWYYLIVSVHDIKVKVRVMDIHQLDKSEELECDVNGQIITEDTVFSTGTEKSPFSGSLYDFRLYVDSSLDNIDIRSIKKNPPCPKNCLSCNGALNCSKCQTGYELSKGQCSIEGLDIETVSLDKITIWNTETLTLPVPTILANSQKFTFSLWMRKKIHSHPTNLNKGFSLVKLLDKDKLEIPVFSEKLINKYSSLYSISQKSEIKEEIDWVHNYSNEVSQWIHILIEFNQKKGRIRYSIKDGIKIYEAKTHLKGKISEIILGDNKGNEINTEFAHGYFYPRVYSKNIIKQIRNKTAPKDCDPGCEKCNYVNGLCEKCKVGSTKPNGQLICGNFLIGFKSAYLYNLQDLTSSRPERFTAFLDKQFNKDVNSMEYSIIGYFRILDFHGLEENSLDKELDIFKISNRYQPNFASPSNDLLTLRVTKNNLNKAIYEFVYSELDKESAHLINLPVEIDEWVLIYATINVIKKQIDYSFITISSQKKLSGTIRLKYFPEKLQEKATLTLFGSDHVTKKHLNLNVYQFYLSPNLRWSNGMIERYYSTFPVIKDPICENCEKCINDFISQKKICLKCASGYQLLNNSCQSVLNVGYKLIADSNKRRFRRPVDDIETSSKISKKTAIVFNFRRNFVPIKEENRDILKAGSLIVSLENSPSGASSLIFKVGNNQATISVNGIDKNLNIDYSWYNVIINFSFNELMVIVKENGKNLIAHKSIALREEVSYSKLSFDDLNYEIEISLPHIIYNGFYKHSLFNTVKHCSQDCNVCIEGKCLDCQYGFEKDNLTCKNKEIRIPAFKITSSSEYSNIYKLGDQLSNLKPLRSPNWTVYFNFRLNRGNFQSFKGKALLRVINHDCEDKKQKGLKIADEILSINFLSNDNFYVQIANRYYFSRYNNPRKFETERFRSTQTNDEYFVGLSFNGENKEFTVIIHNSQSSFIQNTFKFEGATENISQITNLVFGDDLEDIIFSKIHFNYEKAFNAKKLFNKAYENNSQFQKSCLKSSYFGCKQCESKSFLSHGICGPSKIAKSWILSQAQQIHDNLEGGCLESPVSFKVSNLNTFNFWMRRTSYSSDPYGIARIRLENKKEKEFINIYNHDNTLIVDLIDEDFKPVNQVKIVNLYQKNDGFSWIFITISVNIRENNLNVFIYNKNTNENRFASNTSKDECRIFFNNQSRFKIEAGYKHNKLSKNYNFEIGGFTHFLNYETKTTLQSENYRSPVPRSCSDYCKTECNSEGLCPIKNRFSTEVEVSDIFIENKNLKGKSGDKIWKKLPLYRKFKDFVEGFDGTQVWPEYLIAFDVNVQQLYDVKSYKANSRYLVNVHNFNTEESDCKYYNDVISDNFIKFAIFSVENREESLRFYLGGNKANSYVKMIDFAFKKNSMRVKERISIQVQINSLKKLAKISLIIDDLQTFYSVGLDYIPEFIQPETNIFNHPAVSNFRINVHNSRFNYDTMLNYVGKSFKKSIFRSKLCGGKCHKCASGGKQIICLKCYEKYTLIGYSCVKSEINKN